MRRLLVAPIALMLAVPAAGCGGTTDTPQPRSPSVGALARDLVRAEDTDSAHYELDAKVDVKTSGSGLGMSLLAGQPITVHVSGDFARNAFSADGRLSAAGMTFSGKLLVRGRALYVNALGTWYGSRSLHVGALERFRGALGPGLTPRQIRRLERDAGEAIHSTVSDGPTLDGADTWEIRGTLDADGVATLFDEVEGTPLPGAATRVLHILEEAASFTADIGKDDHLLRRVHLAVDLSRDRLRQLDASDVDSLKVSATLDLSKWGERVTIRPPTSYKPLAGLLGRFLGGTLPRRVADF